MRNLVIGLTIALVLIVGGNLAGEQFGAPNMQDVVAGADRMNAELTVAASAVVSVCSAVWATLVGALHRG
jgi:hypothetical protein